MIPYVYLIGWSELQQFYYGVRYATNCHPNDLWVSYFTSSRYVKELYEQYGNPDIVDIRRTFNGPHEAIKWENKVLRRLNVVRNSKWINRTDNVAIAPECGRRTDSLQTRLKKSASRTGKKHSRATRFKISASLQGRDCSWLKGKKRPDHSAAMKGANNSRAITIVYNSKIYSTMKELKVELGITHNRLQRMIQNNLVQIKEKTNASIQY